MHHPYLQHYRREAACVRPTPKPISESCHRICSNFSLPPSPSSGMTFSGMALCCLPLARSPATMYVLHRRERATQRQRGGCSSFRCCCIRCRRRRRCCPCYCCCSPFAAVLAREVPVFRYVLFSLSE